MIKVYMIDYDGCCSTILVHQLNEGQELDIDNEYSRFDSLAKAKKVLLDSLMSKRDDLRDAIKGIKSLKL